jgi:pyrimidine operon attenuation protein/uracil phosphoribosyltransferase
MQKILSSTEIDQKINRLGHQLLEDCFEHSEIFMGGIAGNGFELARRLSQIVEAHSNVKVHLFEIRLNKNEPWSEAIDLGTDRKNMKNGYIVLVDDVINSGKTMQYALTEILNFATFAIKTVVLVDRKHRRFPIKADFVGLSLSTTLKERVEVNFTAEAQAAYLS